MLLSHLLRSCGSESQSHSLSFGCYFSQEWLPFSILTGKNAGKSQDEAELEFIKKRFYKVNGVL